jgi:Tfp pilus assembly protein PilO
MNSRHNFEIYQLITIKTLVYISILSSIVYFVIQPSTEEILTAKNDIETQMADVEERHKKGLSLREVKKQYADIEDRLWIIDEVLLDDGQELVFIDYLESLASESDVKINISLQEKIKTAGNIKLPAKITAEGYSSNLMDFFTAMQLSKYFISISNAHIKETDIISYADDLPSPKSRMFLDMSINLYLK